MFAELSEPDFYDVSAQLELFVWARRQRHRERMKARAAFIKAVPSMLEARRKYQRERLQRINRRRRMKTESQRASANGSVWKRGPHEEATRRMRLRPTAQRAPSQRGLSRLS